MRDPEALYDPTLNEPDPDQEVASKAVFEFVQALREKAEDGLTTSEIFTAAIEHVPGAATKIIELVRGGDPIQSDIEMCSHVVTRQLGVYDIASEE